MKILKLFVHIGVWVWLEDNLLGWVWVLNSGPQARRPALLATEGATVLAQLNLFAHFWAGAMAQRAPQIAYFILSTHNCF